MATKMYGEVHEATKCCHDFLQARPGFQYWISSVTDENGNFKSNPFKAFDNVFDGNTKEEAISKLAERAKEIGCELWLLDHDEAKHTLIKQFKKV